MKTTMNNIVNLAIQVLPESKEKHPYDIVDSAIEIIQKSGVKYKVCPFETVIEAPVDKALELVKQIQEKCYREGAENLMTYIKIQSSAKQDVFIEGKMKKYESNS